MATVTNWIDHLSAEDVVGAVYPGAGSSETLLVILGIVIWICLLYTSPSPRDS